MSSYPIFVDGSTLRVLVVGGGKVAERKVRRLLDSGAMVRVVAPVISTAVRQLARAVGNPDFREREFQPADLDNIHLAIAATDNRAVNATVASLALERRVLVNVVDRPRDGNFITPAVHRSGDVVIAVSAGVPTVAARIRDAIARRFDSRYAEAAFELGKLREELLTRAHVGETGAKAWRDILRNAVGNDFCTAVESGRFVDNMTASHKEVDKNGT
ncbi:MAG: bifunctional precorrin-2 dehydrogenase/sirohydrochlorin ferrochelatase [Gemmatimonadaceae bacterium]